MDTNEETVAHKFLVSYGQSQKRVQVDGTADGAVKCAIREAAECVFALEGKSLILQSYDKDFDDYVDIEDGERVHGPCKLRVQVEEPVTFPVTINVGQDDIESIDACHTVDPVADGTAESITEETDDAPVEDAPVEDASEDDSVEDAPVEAIPEDVVGQPATGWITRFTVPVQPPTLTAKLRDGGQTLKNSELGMFLGSIYNCLTREHDAFYPTQTDYEIIVEKIFRKFPEMKRPSDNLPIGDKKLLWKHRLQYHFQNKRKRSDKSVAAVQGKKLKTSRKRAHTPPTTIDPPTYWGMKNYLPERPASEDDQTILRHVEWLQTEKRKRQLDFKTVSCLMDKTLADRRKWIVSSKPKPAMQEIQAKYPWLFDEDQLSEEMQRVKDDPVPLVKILSAGLGKYSLTLMTKARGRRTPHRFFVEVAEAIPLYQEEKKREDARLAAAFLSIPGLFQERVTDIFIPVDKTTQIPSHLAMDGQTPFTSETFNLVIDGLVVAQSSTVLGAAAAWIEAFYVFNLGYPTAVSKSLTFLQQIILNIDAKIPMSRTMRTKVNELNAAQRAALS